MKLKDFFFLIEITSEYVVGTEAGEDEEYFIMVCWAWCCSIKDFNAFDEMYSSMIGVIGWIFGSWEILLSVVESNTVS